MLFFFLGLFVGTIGTLIGAGGGFILMPLLIFIYPKEEAAILAAMSLAVVFFNALSGTIAYARMRRIDYRSGLIFAAAAIPGAILGSFSVNLIPRKIFDLIFGFLLIAVSVYLIIKPEKRLRIIAEVKPRHTQRSIIDISGETHTFSFNLRTGIFISIFVGFLSTLLGIGGGIIHVPVLSSLLNFPIHLATATSHFTLAITALAGTVANIWQGKLNGHYGKVLWLGAGALIGAQIGARLSRIIHAKWIIRALAIALASVGIRILIK